MHITHLIFSLEPSVLAFGFPQTGQHCPQGLCTCNFLCLDSLFPGYSHSLSHFICLCSNTPHREAFYDLPISNVNQGSYAHTLTHIHSHTLMHMHTSHGADTIHPLSDFTLLDNRCYQLLFYLIFIVCLPLLLSISMRIRI